MSILSWNCRGLGRSRTVQELVCLVQTHRPSAIFISESRQRESVVKGLRYRLGLNNVLVRSSDDKGGGLALYQDDKVIVELKKLDPHFIDVNIVFFPALSIK